MNAKLSGYFDYAAASPMDERVLKAMSPFFVHNFQNPSALYEDGRKVKTAIRQARETVAKVIGAKPVEIIFTAGGTEANNLAITGVMNAFPNTNLIISSIEHSSVYETAKNFKFRECQVKKDGLLDIAYLKDQIDDQTVLISIILANNEIGSIQPIRKISELINEIRTTRKKTGNKLPLYLHSDAAQATNYIDLQVARLGVDLLSLNGGKIYGPKQSGILYVKSGVILKPVIFGGGQERGLRSGSENVANIVGFSEALSLASQEVKSNSESVKKLQEHFIKQLKIHLPKATINGSLKNRLVNNISISISGQDNERLIYLLDEKGYQVAAGSACNASDQEPSHVLKAIGLSDPEIRSTLRLSMGKYTTVESIDGLISELKKITA